MDQPALAGLLRYLVIAVAPTVLIWGAARALPPVLDALRERRRRARRPPQPPLEAVVGDLRRLRRAVRDGGRTRVRRVAVLAAYDETLLQTCRIVGVDAPLAVADPSERRFARLLTEAELEHAGIRLDPPEP